MYGAEQGIWTALKIGRKDSAEQQSAVSTQPLNWALGRGDIAGPTVEWANELRR